MVCGFESHGFRREQVSLTERQRCRSSKPDRRVRLPQDTLEELSVMSVQLSAERADR